MKRLLLLAAFLCATTARAQISVADAQTNTATSATAVTVNITTNTGDAIACMTGENINNTSTVTMSDTASNTYTLLGYNSANSSQRSNWAWTANSTGVTSVTATWSGSLSTRVAMTCIRFTGAATSALEDNSKDDQGGAGVTNLTSGSITTTNANDALIYGIFNQAAGGETAGSGYVFVPNGIGNRIAIQCKMVTSTQSNVTTTMSWTSSSTVNGNFVAFKSGSASVGSCTPAGGATPVINKRRKLERMDTRNRILRRWRDA